MLPGISTASFYPKQTEEALALLAQRRVCATEIFFNSFCELESPFVKELAAIAKSGGVKILSIHPFTSGFEPLLLFSEYPRRTKDGFELYKMYFDSANILGAHIIVMHGDYRGHQQDEKRYFDVFGELMEQASRMGVLLAHENVSRCVGYTPAFFQRMSAYLPQARYVLDTKQCVRADVRISEMMQAMAGRICHVHISDNRGEEESCLPVGKGTCNLQELLRALHVQGFYGGVLQELYRDNYAQEAELFEGYDCLCELVRAAQNG